MNAVKMYLATARTIILSTGLSVAPLALTAAISLFLSNTNSLLARQPPIGVSISQTTERSNYRQIPLGNISSPLTGSNPRTLALRAFGSTAAARSQQVQVSRPTSNAAVVTIAQTGLEDDSVSAIRYRVELRRSSQEWRIVWAGSQTKCQRGRGHQNWSLQLCN